MKFKYGDQVKIVEGFYRGCVGLVREYSNHYLEHPIAQYKILLLDGNLVIVEEKEIALDE